VAAFASGLSGAETGKGKREIGKWTERAAHFGPPVSFWGKEGHGVPCPYREGVRGR
jgi:hypothetical protein